MAKPEASDEGIGSGRGRSHSIVGTAMNDLVSGREHSGAAAISVWFHGIATITLCFRLSLSSEEARRSNPGSHDGWACSQQIGHDKGSESDGTNLSERHDWHRYHAQVIREGPPHQSADRHPQRDAAYEADQGHGGGLPEHSEGHLAAKEAEGFEKADLLAPTGNTHHQHVQKCGYAEDDEHRPQDQRKVHRLTEIDEIRRRYR